MKTTRRVIVLGPTYPSRGGISQHTTLLAHHLEQAGHEVALWSWAKQYPNRLYPGGVATDGPEVPSVDRVSYPLSWNRPLSWWRTGRRLAREQPDIVVLAWSNPFQAPAYATVLAAGRIGSRTIAICHNVLPHERRPFDRMLTRSVLRQARSLVVHTEAQGQVAREVIGADATVTPLPPNIILGSASRRPPGQPPHRRLLFFGTVRQYKGLDVLLRALAKCPSWITLRVAGEFWESEAEIRRLVTMLHLEERVEIRAGYVEAAELRGVFSDVDALVLPYRSATATCNALVGYDHGKPVVASSVGNLGDEIRHGVDGLLVPPDDTVSLAEALRHLYEPGVLDRLSAGVDPVDWQGIWKAYGDAVLGALPPTR